MESDFVLETVVNSATASDAVGLCARLLSQESTGLSAVTALLERVRMGMEEEAGLRTILQGIRGACAPPSAVCDQLLQLLPLVTPPTAVVEALPYFVGEDPGEVRNVVKEYKDLLEGDRSMLVHVIGSLYELPLGADTRQEVSTMTLEALPVVDEEDVPVVVRTLFKMASEKDSVALVSRVRAECAGLGTTALAVLVGVLADTFSVNESVAKAFLAEVSTSVASPTPAGDDPGSDVGARGNGTGGTVTAAAAVNKEQDEPTNSLSTLDVIALLLLLPQRRHETAVHGLLDKISRKPERLPTDIIVSLAERSGNAPWTCLASPIRELGLWAAIALPSPDRTRAAIRNGTGAGASGGSGGSGRNSSNAKAGSAPRSAAASASLRLLRKAGTRILLAVFRGHPNARALIVSCCLGVVGTHRLPARGSGAAARTGGTRAVERDAAADALLETCLGALDLLLELSENCAVLMSPFANTVGDLVLGGGGRALHPRLLDKAARCLAALARHSNGMINELMNHVQKQVFFLGAGAGGSGGGGGVFRGGIRDGLQPGGRVAGMGVGVGRSGDPDARRRSAIVLATHLIRGGALEERDEEALIGWAVRLLSLLRGGPSSLDTVTLTLELLATATSNDPQKPPRGGHAAGGGRGGSSRSGGDGGGSSSGGGRGTLDQQQRREGWKRAGASTAGRCLARMGVLRLEASGEERAGGGGGSGGSAGRRGRRQAITRDEVLVDVTHPPFRQAGHEQGKEGEGQERANFSDLRGGERRATSRGGAAAAAAAARNGQGKGRRPEASGSMMHPAVAADATGAATLCVRDMARAIWREGNTSLSASARSLHNSWFAAITLSCGRDSIDSPKAAAAGVGGSGAVFHSDGSHPSLGGAAPGGGVDRRGDEEGGGRENAGVVGAGHPWLRAQLSMPVWPFSDDFYAEGNDAVAAEDSGGYWRVGAGVDGGVGGGGWALWRIPAAESAWQGIEGTQKVIEAGAACVAARSLLSSAARYLIPQLPSFRPPPSKVNNNNNNGCSAGDGRQEDGGSEERLAAERAAALRGQSSPTVDLLSDLAWRYLELGARGRVCVAALRRAAREMAGNGGGGGGGRGGFAEADGDTAAVSREEERVAAARLEEGLSLELMPLECLCRLVNAAVESRVSATTTSAMAPPPTASAVRAPTTATITKAAPPPRRDDEISGSPLEIGVHAGECGGRSFREEQATMGGVMDSVATPSVVLVAYVELLRTLVTRLGADGDTAPAAAAAAAAAATGGYAAVRALDLETLFRATIACSQALPAVRKAQASKTAAASSAPPASRAKLTPQKRRASRTTAHERLAATSGKRGGGGGGSRPGGEGMMTAVMAKRPRLSAGDGSGGSARMLSGDSVRRRQPQRSRGADGGLREVAEGRHRGGDGGGEGEEGDEEGSGVSSDEVSLGSGWESPETDDSDDDSNSLSDESDQDPKETANRPASSTPRGKTRAAAAAGPWAETPSSVRKSGPSVATGARRGRSRGPAGAPTAGAGVEEAAPWEGLSGLSLCQFWRYRLLLEVMLAAKGGGGVSGRDEGGHGGGRGGSSQPQLVEVLERLAAAASPRTSSAVKTAGEGGGGSKGGTDEDTTGQAVFLELSRHFDRAEDGLLAGIITEVLAALSTGVPSAEEETAALSWKGLGAVYPRGYGEGYSHLGGVLEGLRRNETSLLSSPVSLRFFLRRHGAGITSRMRGQLAFAPRLGSTAARLSRTGLPSIPFMQHALLTHWALAGRTGRPWALAAAVVDIEAFVLGTSVSSGNKHSSGNGSGAPGSSKKSARHKPLPSSPSSPSLYSQAAPPRLLLCQENFDTFVAAVVKLLPASLILAAPHALAAAAAPHVRPRGETCADDRSRGSAEGGAGSGSKTVWRGGGRPVPGGATSQSPYEESECLGLVLECLVEACTEGLDSGAWNSCTGMEELAALGRLLRRFVLPVAMCCSKALRALEGQLEKSLAWRCSQTLVPKGAGKRGRESLVPRGSAEGVDYGAAVLCRGLLEQCDRCVGTVRGLCIAVRAVALSQDDGVAKEASSSSSKPHRAALDRLVKVLPGMALQSDQLSAAVDSARMVLQLPRVAKNTCDGGNGDGDEGGKEGISPTRQRHRGQQSTPKSAKRASQRLLSLFAASGGGDGARGRRQRTCGTVGGTISSERLVVSRGRIGERSGLLGLGAELRRSLTGADPSKRVFRDSTACVSPTTPRVFPVRETARNDRATAAAAEIPVERRQRQQAIRRSVSNGAGAATKGNAAGDQQNLSNKAREIGDGDDAATLSVQTRVQGGAAADDEDRGIETDRGRASGDTDNGRIAAVGEEDAAWSSSRRGSQEEEGADDDDGGTLEGSGFEAFGEEQGGDIEEEDEEEEEENQFRAVGGGWGTYS